MKRYSDNGTSPFRAFFDNGVIAVWGAPQSWRKVFKSFKALAQWEGHGTLYCGKTKLKESGLE